MRLGIFLLIPVIFASWRRPDACHNVGHGSLSSLLNFLNEVGVPIHEYRPLNSSGQLLSWEEAADRRCCFFEFLSLFQEQPIENCPSCGRSVGRCPSRFSFGGVGQAGGESGVLKKTVDALRAEGLGDYAAAWAEADASLGQKRSGSVQEGDSSLDQARAVRSLLESQATEHVCTSWCKH